METIKLNKLVASNGNSPAPRDSGEDVTLLKLEDRNRNLIHLLPEMLRSEWIEVHAGQSTQGGLLRPWGEGALARRVAGVADDDQRQRLSDRVTIGFGPGSSAARGSGTNVPLVLQSVSAALHLPSTGGERGDSGKQALRV